MAGSVDKVPVVCPNCNKRLLVPAGTLGKQGRCPACQTVFTLEQLWEAEPVQPAAPQLAPLSPFGASAPSQNAFAPAAPNAWGAPAPAASPFGNPAPAANSWGTPAAPSAAKSPYSDDDFQGDYQMQAAPPVTVNPYSTPQYTPVSSGGYSGSYQRKPESNFWNGSVMGGIALMVIAVVWFVGGLAVNIIFIYPPIMFIIGLVTFFKGLFAGNLAGD